MTAARVVSIDRFESVRHFQLWRYEVGHAQLLLRSVRAADLPSRVDVLSKDVRALNLPTSLDRLSIVRDGNEFTLRGNGWSGEILAEACFLAEDEGEYFDPSEFEDPFGPRH